MERHPNFVLARRLWNGIASGDAEALRAVLAEKSVWRMNGRSPLAGTYVGVDAILDFMARVGELTDDLHSDLIDIYVAEQGAVLRYSLEAQRGTQRLRTEQLFVFRSAHGRIVEAFFVPTDQYAYDRFFLPQ